MPQRVWRYPPGQVGSLCVALQELPAPLPRQSLTPLVQEQRRLRACLDEARTRLGEVRAGCFHGRPADGHHALFRALADTTDGCDLEVEVVHVEGRQLGDTEAGGVEQLEHGAVPCRGSAL